IQAFFEMPKTRRIVPYTPAHAPASLPRRRVAFPGRRAGSARYPLRREAGGSPSFTCLRAAATSQSLTVWSLPAEASVRPSGLKRTDSTRLVCPRRVPHSLPVVASHTLTVLSRLAEATALPSGLKPTE